MTNAIKCELMWLLFLVCFICRNMFMTNFKSEYHAIVWFRTTALDSFTFLKSSKTAFRRRNIPKPWLKLEHEFEFFFISVWWCMYDLEKIDGNINMHSFQTLRKFLARHISFVETSAWRKRAKRDLFIDYERDVIS